MPGWMGCAIRREAKVGSTNELARAWAREGAPHGAVVVAKEQTDGRGRRGRGFVSSKGMGLWLSAIIRPDRPRGEWPLLSFAASLSAADAVQAVTGLAPALKWPNDLLLAGRKIAGILLEGEGEAVIVGIGINVRQREADFPEALRQKAGSLEMIAGKGVSIMALEGALLGALEARVEGWNFMGEYARRCATIGQKVRVARAEDAFQGVANGLDGTGALIVLDESGKVCTVYAGDVSIRGEGGYV